jgi:hypothetical protein
MVLYYFEKTKHSISTLHFLLNYMQFCLNVLKSGSPESGDRIKMRLIVGTAKCRHLKNRPVKGLCGRCLSVWGPEPGTAPLHTVCILYLFTQGRGRELNHREVRGPTVHKVGSKIQYHRDWLYLQSKRALINTCRKVHLQVNIFRWRHFALVSI